MTSSDPAVDRAVKSMHLELIQQGHEEGEMIQGVEMPKEFVDESRAERIRTIGLQI